MLTFCSQTSTTSMLKYYLDKGRIILLTAYSLHLITTILTIFQNRGLLGRGDLLYSLFPLFSQSVRRSLLPMAERRGYPLMKLVNSFKYHYYRALNKHYRLNRLIVPSFAQSTQRPFRALKRIFKMTHFKNIFKYFLIILPYINMSFWDIISNNLKFNFMFDLNPQSLLLPFQYTAYFRINSFK